VLLVVSILVFADLAKRVQQQNQVQDDDVVFVSSQLDYALQQFLIGLAQLNDEAISSEALQLRFDLLWSRVLVSSNGATGRRIIARPGASETLDGLLQALKTEEQAVVSLLTEDKQEISRLFQHFSGFTKHVHEITVEVLEAKQKELQRRRTQFDNAKLTSLIIVSSALVCALVLLLLMLAESRRANTFARRNLSLVAVSDHFGRGVVATKVNDGNHRIEFCNNVFASQVGLSPDVLPGQDLASVLQSRSTQLGSLDLNNSKMQQVEIQNGAEDNSSANTFSMLWRYLQINPASDPNDHRVGLLIDISEQKRNEIELVKAKERAEAGDRAKSDFLAIMSHEIRTPLNAIIGMIEILKNDKGTEQQDQFLDVAHDSSIDLLEIVNNILNFSKLETGDTEIETTNFELDTQLAKVCQLFRPAAEKKGLQLKYQTAADIPPVVNGHANVLRQLMFNLISNAVKFTREGQISIEAAMHERAGLPMLQVQVIDTGPGIPENRIDNVFNPFYQADNDEGLYSSGSGTGLGLAICQRLVDRVGGTISCSNRHLKGTIFQIQLPITEVIVRDASMIGASVSEQVSTSTNLERFVGLHVLVVEDSNANRLVASNLLESANLKVSLAENGQQAVDAVTRSAFDLVFMDMRMPVLDGFKATRSIRQLAVAWNQLPIVALTADAIGTERDVCIDAGMNDYICKPYTRDDLLATIDKYCKIESSADSSRTVVKIGSTSQNSADIILSSLQKTSNHQQFDLSVLEELVRQMPTETASSLIATFVDEADQRSSRIQNLIESRRNGDLSVQKTNKQLSEQVHSLKGEADTFGAVKLARIARDFETICAVNGTDTDYVDIVDRLSVAVTQIKAATMELRQ